MSPLTLLAHDAGASTGQLQPPFDDTPPPFLPPDMVRVLRQDILLLNTDKTAHPARALPGYGTNYNEAVSESGFNMGALRIARQALAAGWDSGLSPWVELHNPTLVQLRQALDGAMCVSADASCCVAVHCSATCTPALVWDTLRSSTSSRNGDVIVVTIPAKGVGLIDLTNYDAAKHGALPARDKHLAPSAFDTLLVCVAGHTSGAALGRWLSTHAAIADLTTTTATQIVLTLVCRQLACLFAPPGQRPSDWQVCGVDGTAIMLPSRLAYCIGPSVAASAHALPALALQENKGDGHGALGSARPHQLASLAGLLTRRVGAAAVAATAVALPRAPPQRVLAKAGRHKATLLMAAATGAAGLSIWRAACDIGRGRVHQPAPAARRPRRARAPTTGTDNPKRTKHADATGQRATQPGQPVAPSPPTAAKPLPQRRSARHGRSRTRRRRQAAVTEKRRRQPSSTSAGDSDSDASGSSVESSYGYWAAKPRVTPAKRPQAAASSATGEAASEGEAATASETTAATDTPHAVGIAAASDTRGSDDADAVGLHSPIRVWLDACREPLPWQRCHRQQPRPLRPPPPRLVAPNVKNVMVIEPPRRSTAERLLAGRGEGSSRRPLLHGTIERSTEHLPADPHAAAEAVAVSALVQLGGVVSSDCIQPAGGAERPVFSGSQTVQPRPGTVGALNECSLLLPLTSPTFSSPIMLPASSLTPPYAPRRPYTHSHSQGSHRPTQHRRLSGFYPQQPPRPPVSTQRTYKPSGYRRYSSTALRQLSSALQTSMNTTHTMRSCSSVPSPRSHEDHHTPSLSLNVHSLSHGHTPTDIQSDTLISLPLYSGGSSSAVGPPGP